MRATMTRDWALQRHSARKAQGEDRRNVRGRALRAAFATQLVTLGGLRAPEPSCLSWWAQLGSNQRSSLARPC
jgi:hypothetical protein